MDAVKMFYPQTESLVLYRDLLHIPLAPGNFGNKRYHLSFMSNIGSSSISNGFVKISPTPHFKSFNKAAVRCAAVSSEMEATPSTYIPAAQIQLPEGPWKQVPGGVTAAIGFKAAGVYGGVRVASRKPDLALVSCDVDAAAAGAFTENVVAAAPVLYCRKVLSASSVARGVLINAGQANAATGDAGYQDTLDCAEAVAKLLGVNPETILIESTGVIGQRIKKEALLNSLPKLVDSLSSTAEGAKSAAVAITTTDLVSKSVALETQIGGRTVKIGGMAKGSGMIHPNMATLLSVITSDAVVTVDLWRKMVLTAVKRSFNQITVDGDSSTNDTVVALASGLSGAREITSLEDLEAQQLQAALDAMAPTLKDISSHEVFFKFVQGNKVMQGLAKSIASDGEGATCLIEVTVTGANSESDAAKVARSVASSSLTKAAIYGRDPNWGRIACAAGYAGIPFKLNDLHITLGDIVLMDGGQPLPFDRAAASAYLRKAGETHGTVLINISIGSGEGVSQAWGCDLSYDYVKINAEYTT